MCIRDSVELTENIVKGFIHGLCSAKFHIVQRLREMRICLLYTSAAETELSFPVEDWTVPQPTNLLGILYSHQHILRRMRIMTYTMPSISEPSERTTRRLSLT